MKRVLWIGCWAQEIGRRKVDYMVKGKEMPFEGSSLGGGVVVDSLRIMFDDLMS